MRGLPLFVVRWAALAVGLVIVVVSVQAQAAEQAPPPKLGLPIDCHMGESCWLVNLVDLDPGPGRADYRCGAHTYDGHKGVDIAIKDLAAMTAGVPVLAAAPGVVKAVRDGMPDRHPDNKFRREFKHLYCGNGIVVEHGGGWETQYCHLRRGSLNVKAGQKVGRGDPLGLVGHSGMAEFPHVHLSVRRAGDVVDPFIGGAGNAALMPTTACGPGEKTLWTRAALRVLSAPMTAFYNLGFAAERPKLGSIRKGFYKAKALSRRSPVLIFWVETWWVREGDRLEMRITGPDGDVVVKHASELPKSQARRMVFAGRKKPGLFWPAGIYKGEVRLTRQGGGKTQVFRASRDIFMRD